MRDWTECEKKRRKDKKKKKAERRKKEEKGKRMRENDNREILEKYKKNWKGRDWKKEYEGRKEGRTTVKRRKRKGMTQERG